MRHVEIKNQREGNTEDLDDRPVWLVIGGLPVEVPLTENYGVYTLSLLASDEERDALLSLAPNELGQAVNELHLPFDASWAGLLGNMSGDNIVISTQSIEETPPTKHFWNARYYFDFDLPNWASPWSASAAFDAIDREIGDSPNPTLMCGTSLGESEIPSLWFDCLFPRQAQSIGDEVSHTIDRIRGAFVRASAHLELNRDPDSLVSVFDFPEPVKPACEQYLAYFAQFLRDLGINADTSLKEKAGHVLFTVTPTGGREALHRIRHALAAYLELSDGMALESVPEASRDLAVQQLYANVLHLRSQFTLAVASVQLKDAAIALLQTNNAQLSAALVQATVAASKSGSADNTEPVAGPYLRARKVELTGLEIDTPGIIRALRRRFGKEAKSLLVPSSAEASESDAE